jgi:predicted DNA-binding transcriptional regulator YafY
MLGDRLEVSPRTIYRDIADLMCSGVPITGEAGVGYRLDRGFDLPPLMFTEAEVEAIVLGTRLVSAFSDPQMSRSAEDVLAKVERVLPARLIQHIENTRLYGHSFQAREQNAESMAIIRQALRLSHKIQFQYQDRKGQPSLRQIRPLGLTFLGHAWLLTGWCELRNAFRNFRLDRISELSELTETFAPEVGKRFEDFLAVMEEKYAGH